MAPAVRHQSDLPRVFAGQHNVKILRWNIEKTKALSETPKLAQFPSACLAHVSPT